MGPPRILPADTTQGISPVVQVAGIDLRRDAVMVGVQMFPVRELHIMHPLDRRDEAAAVGVALQPLLVSTILRPVERTDLVALLDAVVAIVHAAGPGAMVINLSGAWEEYAIAALTAAFLTGSPAFVVQGHRAVPVPVLHFDEPALLSPTKHQILVHLAAFDRPALLRELAQRAELHPGLVSYHVRGYRGRPGLEGLGLVETVSADARGHAVRLTPLGRNILNARRDAHREGAIRPGRGQGSNGHTPPS